jgi:NAD+ kinase
MPFKNITLVTREDLANRERILKEIVHLTEKAGTTLHIDTKPSKNTDVHIVVGGDGTMIAAVRELTDFSISLLGIHHGTLGFLSSMEIGEIETKLSALLRGEGVIDERQLLAISIEENGQTKSIGRVLNEAAISQGGISRLMYLHTMIDGQELTTFRADGLIVATPTGSTAYSLAAGGTIIHPNALGHATILTPINPHSFFQKPLIVPGDADVVIEVITKENAFREIHPVLTLDGQVTHPLRTGQRIHITAHTEHVKFLRTKEDNFYRKIREKLGWGE